MLAKNFQNGSTPLEMKEKNNKYPYIVAVGENMKDIRQYFIDLEGHFISVSKIQLPKPRIYVVFW